MFVNMDMDGCLRRLFVLLTVVSALDSEAIIDVAESTTDGAVASFFGSNRAGTNDFEESTEEATPTSTLVVETTSTTEVPMETEQEEEIIVTDTPTTPEIYCPVGLHQNNYRCFFIKQSTFPFDCPYKDMSVHIGFSSTKKVWEFAKRNTSYGYYEYLDVELPYTLFQRNDGSINTKDDCIVFYQDGNFSTESCSNMNEVQCGYLSPLINRHNYCKAYSEICETNKTCWCNPSDTHNQHTCQIGCVVNKEDACNQCRNKFKQYPKARIQLSYGGGTEIRVTVTDPMKLACLPFSNIELQCFTDAKEVDSDFIYSKISPLEISINKNQRLFNIDFNHVGLYVGRYWCEAYLYPNFEKIVSNTVIAGASAYPLCFVVNVTVNASDYTFLPYNAHTSVAGLLHDRINEQVVVSLVEIFPLYDSYIKMAFRLSVGHPPDWQDEYNSLQKLLQNLTVEIRSCAICIRDVAYWDGKEVYWPDASIGQTVPPKTLLVQANGLPITRSCLGTFTYGAYWSRAPEPTNLGGESPITEDLHNLVNSTKTAEEKNELLTEILEGVSEAIPYDVYLIASVLEQIAQSQDEFDLVKFMSNLNNVIDMDSATLSTAQEVLNATDMILYSLDVALGTYANSPDKIIESRYVSGQTIDVRATKINGMGVYNKKGKLVVENLVNVRSIADLNFEDLKLASFLPPKLMDYIINQTEVEINRLVTTMFKNDALFIGDGNLTNFGGVLGVYVSNLISTILPEPLPVVFRRDESIKSKDVRCGHWNYGINDMQVSILGSWDTDLLPQVIKEKYLLCYYDHMTHFALLMGAPNDEVLNIVSIIGCALSFIGVSAILITGLFFKNWRRSASVKLLLNFSGALLGQMVFLFVSSFVKYEERNWLCSIVAVGLHYFVIAQFCWMLTISYLQYKKFVHSLTSETKYLLLKACLLGWISPVLPVTIVFAIDASSYSYNCYLTGIYLQFGIMLPAGCIIGVNVVMFVKVCLNLSRNKTRAYGEKDRMILAKIKWGVALYFLTGFSWIFGLLANFLDSLVLSYLFCVTSTIQGLVLCVYFCALNENVKKMWMKKMSYKRGGSQHTATTHSKEY